MLRVHDYREEPFGSIELWRFLQGTPSEYLLNWTGTKAEAQCQDSKRMVVVERSGNLMNPGIEDEVVVEEGQP